MSEWKEYKLGEVITIKYGKDHKNLKDGKYPVYGSGGIMRYADNFLYDKESILIPRKGSLNNIFYREKAFWTVDTMFYSEIDTTKVFPKFLYYQLTLVDFENLNVGSAVPSLTIPIINDIDISLPPLPEQIRIASILSSLDDKIDLLHRENKTLEAMAETLFRQWFIEEAKEDWEEKPLSFYGKIVCGKTPPKKESKYFGGETPFIKIPDMHNKTFVINSEDSLTKEGVLYQKEKILPPFSIIVSCIATVGLVVLNAKEAQTNQQINSIIPYEEEYRYFLYLHLMNMYDDLNAMASGGTATLNLNTSNFSKIKIAYPTDDVLCAFNKQVSLLFDKIYNNQKQIQTLIQQRDSLLPKLMSGEVKI